MEKDDATHETLKEIKESLDCIHESLSSIDNVPGVSIGNSTVILLRKKENGCKHNSN